MHLRRHQVSLMERLASFAAATAVTVGTALLVLAAPGASLVTAPVAVPAPNARQLSEHLVYVARPVPAPSIAAGRQPTRSSARTELRRVDPARSRVPAPTVDSASLAPDAANPRTTTPAPAEATSPSPTSAGAPVAGAAVGFRRPSSPVRFDSAVRALSESLSVGLATGRLQPPPPTQAERDAKWRDEAFEVVAEGDPSAQTEADRLGSGGSGAAARGLARARRRLASLE